MTKNFVLIIVSVALCACGTTPQQVRDWTDTGVHVINSGAKEYKELKPLFGKVDELSPYGIRLGDYDPEPPAWQLYEKGGDENPDWNAKERWDAWQQRQDIQSAAKIWKK